MDKSYYSLEVNKSNRVTRIFQLVFGIVCAAVAVIWMFLNLNTLKVNGTLWITIIFLLGFAYFQVNSGLGRAEKFIEFGPNSIRMKRNSIFPPSEIEASEIIKIVIHPVNLVFFLRNGKNVILRFGTTYTDIIEPVKKEIESFCSVHNLSFEFREDEL
ncbi:MAG: hypothetical protein WAL29_12635 [Bacteroidales bacterium]